MSKAVTAQPSLLFSADGKLTPDAMKACNVMNIDPETLAIVNEQDFIRHGVDEKIAKIRVKHLMEKRTSKLFMLENCIRSGMMHQLNAVINMKQNPGSANLKAAAPYAYQPSDIRVDVPLRETFDPESRLNRQLAKQTYEREKVDRVHTKKEELQTQFSADLVNAQKKKDKAFKKIQAIKAAQRKEDIVRAEELEEKRNAVRERNAAEQRTAYLERLDAARQADEETQEKKAKKDAARLKHEQDLFRADMENLEKKGAKQHEVRDKLEREEKHLAKQLESVETKVKRAEDVAAAAVRARRAHYHSFNVKADETLNRVRGQETHLPQRDIDAIANKFRKVSKVDRKLELARKAKAKDAEDAEEALLERVRANKESLRAEAREKAYTLKEGIANSGHLVGEVKNAMREEIL
jgi:hypothetical protein